MTDEEKAENRKYMPYDAMVPDPAWIKGIDGIESIATKNPRKVTEKEEVITHVK